jgi:hypothetical protein
MSRVLRQAQHEEDFIAISADAMKKNPHPEPVEGPTAPMQAHRSTRDRGQLFRR